MIGLSGMREWGLVLIEAVGGPAEGTWRFVAYEFGCVTGKASLSAKDVSAASDRACRAASHLEG